MNPAPHNARRSGFTLVELLISIALGVLIAGLLATLLHGLLSAGDKQSARIRGPFAARSALRALSREITCAFAPPVKDLAPLRLSTSTEPGKPEVQLVFFAPVPAEPFFAHGYDIEQVTYQVIQNREGQKDLLRISVPCSGPATNNPITNRLLVGSFTLVMEAVTNDVSHTEWPPKKMENPTLPSSLRLALTLPREAPLQTEVLIQAASGIRSPIERQPAAPEENENK